MSEQHEFQTEVSRLLDIVANALYTEREIFLRELISNASDACDRLRYLAISTPELAGGDTDYKISITTDAKARTLTIADNGIGMTRDELVKNLGTIAHSGTREVIKGFDGARADMNLIGQFGVGFYSAFMVADKVDVTSRKAGSDEAHVWSSDGRGGYSIGSARKDTRGTEIVIHLKDDAGEFLLGERVKAVIKKYSDHITFPIVLNDSVANTASALWMKSKSEISDDQYAEFYRGIADTMGLDHTPWMTLHWRAEGAIEYTNLLFIPGVKPFDLYDPKRHHGVKLYVKRVFITDGVEGLIPPFLRFVKGVVDSEDVPLNISREMLQSNPIVAKMGSAITRKILGELETRAKDDPEGFEQFWALFGPVVKEGLYDAHAHREQLCRVARFYSSRNDGLVSFDDYIERMAEGQEHIYYISAPTIEAARNSPQLEAFRAKGVEVLFMTDTVDEFWIPMQQDYKQKKLKSVTRGDADLSAVKGAQDDTPQQESAGDNDQLVARLRDILAGEVKDVKLSTRLVDSPVCLVAPENDLDMHMQRVLKRTQGYDGAHQHILEINPKHPLITRLRDLVANEGSGDAVRDTALLLLDQARILEGEPLANPADFVKRMSAALQRGLPV